MAELEINETCVEFVVGFDLVKLNRVLIRVGEKISMTKIFAVLALSIFHNLIERGGKYLHIYFIK
jgi:hypothetical protein